MIARRDHGFSLPEMLVALVVISGMSAMLFDGLAQQRRLWERDTRVAEDGAGVAAAQTVIREAIEQAYPWSRFGGSHPAVEFDGEAGAMRFIGVAPIAERPAELRRVTVGTTSRGELALEFGVADRRQSPPTERRVLIAGVQAAEIAYFGTAPPDGTPRWRDRWHSQPAPPTLVRLRLRFAERDRRIWPDLIVRPAATIDSACVVDARGACKGR